MHNKQTIITANLILLTFFSMVTQWAGQLATTCYQIHRQKLQVSTSKLRPATSYKVCQPKKCIPKRFVSTPKLSGTFWAQTFVFASNQR